MIIRKPSDLRYSDVTPKQLYMDRRRFLTAGSAALGALTLPLSLRADNALGPLAKSPFSTTEKLTPLNIVTGFNNYYEFGTDKFDPAKNATKFVTRPWTVSFEGEIAKPRTLDIDEIMKLAPLEERIYRHRCVEGWSIVVPWIGFPLSTLLKQVEPTSKAKYVAFQSDLDRKQMPLATSFQAGIEFPYLEGLLLDEAMHPLTLLCVGLYGEVLPNQNGAPVRLVIPWKYGFKSIKSIVRIRFTEKQPPTTWNRAVPSDYGFYCNVNPDVARHRDQSKEQRIGVDRGNQTTTRLFNGYGDQVASLYAGLDLRKNY
jgi:methionine sulfoxide reductase catalytic subunit